MTDGLPETTYTYLQRAGYVDRLTGEVNRWLIKQDLRNGKLAATRRIGERRLQQIKEWANDNHD